MMILSYQNGREIRQRTKGIIQLYLGSPNFTLTPSVTFHYPGKDSLNDFIGGCGIGDINKDGYADFALNGAFGDWGAYKGKAFIYLGGPTIDTVPIAELYEPWKGDGFRVVAGIGDINKDGYDDFAAGSTYNWTNGNGYAYVFYGGDTISWNRCTTVTYGNSNFYGTSIANIGDINNDGFDDLAIGAPYDSSGKVYVYYGGSSLDTTADTILTPPASDYSFGRIIKRDSTNSCFVLGGSNIYKYSKAKCIYTIDGAKFGVGGYVNIEANCDLNGDGIDDIIIGNTNYKNQNNTMVGGAFVCYRQNNLDTTVSVVIQGENKWDEYSKIITTADVNNDGCSELFIMSPNYPDYNSPQGKIYIYSHKKITGVENKTVSVPHGFSLYQNYPNPFNPKTVIGYSLSSTGIVTLTVYDLLGKKVATLVNGRQGAGEHQATFDANRLTSGVYFYRLKTAEGILQKKMILIK